MALQSASLKKQIANFDGIIATTPTRSISFGPEFNAYTLFGFHLYNEKNLVYSHNIFNLIAAIGHVKQKKINEFNSSQTDLSLI